jgi:hypothetical protein
MERAFGQYIEDVKSRRFPAAEHANTMDPQAFRALMQEINLPEDLEGRDEDSPTQYH